MSAQTYCRARLNHNKKKPETGGINITLMDWRNATINKIDMDDNGK